MFLQIHTLVSYPASLLNRDDAGLAKRIPFGDATRLRISSQCLKRHWRQDMVKLLPDVPDGLRTRSLFSRTVLPKLIDGGAPRDVAEKLVDALAKAVIDGGVKDGGDLSQPVLFGKREADYFFEIAMAASREPKPLEFLAARLKSADERKNLKAMSKSAAGLTASLFGRFVTSDLLARVDAPVHVAHAFTIHGASTEMDYFTVVDDLNRDDETGAAHANQAELGSGLYYGYVAVDLPLLVSNLGGADAKDWKALPADTPRKVLDFLVRTIATCSPGAKLGSTAPHGRADLVLLEVGDLQPRSLANAFLEALPARGNMLQSGANRLAGQLNRLDQMYGPTAKVRALATTLDPSAFSPLPTQSLDAAIGISLDALWK